MSDDLSTEIQRLLSVPDLTVLSAKRDLYATLKRFGFEGRFKVRCEELGSVAPYAGDLGLRYERVLRELLGVEGEVEHVAPTKHTKREDGELALISALLRAGEGRTAPIDEEIRWVTRNIPRKWSDIKMDEVPSDWAVSTLAYAKKNEGEFRKAYDARVAGARADKQSGGKGFHDDGRTMELLTEQLKEMTKDE